MLTVRNTLVPDELTGEGPPPPRDIDDARDVDEIPVSEDLSEQVDANGAAIDAFPPVPLRVKVGYGFGEIGIFVSNAILSYYLTPFLLDVALLKANVVAIVLLSATAFDAITDLIFGLITDATKSDFGRRRPYILMGSIAWSGTFIALFQSPNVFDEQQRETYYICFLLLYKAANTVCSVPYYGLVSEITPSYSERTKLSGLRLLVSLSSAAIFSFLWAIITNAFPYKEAPDQPDQQLGYALAAVAFLPLILFPAVGVFTQIKEPPMVRRKRRNQEELTWRQLLQTIFTNKPFVYVLTLYGLVYLAINLVQNNLLLWVKYVLRVPDQFRWIILTVQLASMASVFFWIPFAARFGKKIAFVCGALPFILVLACSWLITADVYYMAYVLAVVAGFGVGALMLMPWSMMADCIDVDELNTGKRREGIYFAAFVLFQKFALAAGLAASNFSLGAAGYQNHPPGSPKAGYQPHDVITVLKILLGPVVASAAALSLIPALLYPLTKEKHQEILEQIRAQRRQTAITRRTTRRTARKTDRSIATSDGAALDVDDHSHHLETVSLLPSSP